MKKIFLTCLFLGLAAGFVYVGVKEGGNTLIGGIVLAVLFAVLGIRQLSKKPGGKDAAPAPAAKAPARPRQAPKFVNFSVAGATYQNDDGSDRQTILRHIKFQDAPYVTGDSADVEIAPFTYRGEPAFRVLINGYQIGNVPREKIADVRDAVDHGAQVSGFQVTGGGKGRDGSNLYYGCDIALRYPDGVPLQ